MSGNIFIDAQEVANELGTSKAYAYKLIKRLNEEMKASGFITVQGKINGGADKKLDQERINHVYNSRKKKAIRLYIKYGLKAHQQLES